MRGYYYYYISSLSVVKRIVLPVPAAASSSAESSEDRRGAKTNCFSRKSFLCRLLVLVVRVKDKLWEMIRVYHYTKGLLGAKRRRLKSHVNESEKVL